MMSNAEAQRQSFSISKGVINTKIENLTMFAAKSKNHLTSETVHIRGFAWKLECSSKVNQYFSGAKWTFMECVSSIKCSRTNKPIIITDWSCEAHVIFKVKAIESGKRDRVIETTHRFGSKSKEGSCSFSYKFQYLMDPENGWYDASTDSITLSAEIEARAPTGLGNDCRIHEQLGTLFENIGGQFSDCTLVAADGKEFKIYKSILACRSPVFAAMFRHDLAETRNNLVEITDIKSEALGHLLRYIYTGAEPIDIGKIAGELLAAADKYELERLKIICEHELTNSLAIENACEILTLARSHSVDHLEKETTKFIQEHINEVMATDGWNLLRNENGALTDQLVKEEMTRKRKQQSPL